MMTDGEKRIWAAAYAAYYVQENLKCQNIGAKFYTSTAVECAWAAVTDARTVIPAVLEGWGDREELAMLKEMLSDDSPS